MEDEGDGDTNCNWCTRNNTQKLSKRTLPFPVQNGNSSVQNEKNYYKYKYKKYFINYFNNKIVKIL